MFFTATPFFFITFNYIFRLCCPVLYMCLCYMNRHNISLCCPKSWVLARSWSNNELAGKGADLNSLKKEFSETWRCTVGFFPQSMVIKTRLQRSHCLTQHSFFQCLFVFLWGNFCFCLINANCTPKCFMSLARRRQKQEAQAEGTSQLSLEMRGKLAGMNRRFSSAEATAVALTVIRLRTWGRKRIEPWRNTMPRDTLISESAGCYKF